MSVETVKALYYKENNIGNWLKKSKKQYVWKLEVDGETHHIEFMDSVLSGKKKIAKNGMVVFERQLFGVPFQYPFTIGKHTLNIAMHGDKYELRIDGMSFSHLYNLTKTQQMSKGENIEEYNAEGYGDDYSSGSYPTKSKKYDDAFDDYETTSKPAQYKKDPDDWSANPKPASSKFEGKSRPKQAEDFEDTGYDGWNDVKRSGTSRKEIPDPYASNTKYTSKYDPYPEDDVFEDKNSGNTRGKATTVVGKNNDFFSGGFDQPIKQKKKDFDGSNQPKTFDFNEFGEAPPKNGKKDDFEDVFKDAPKSKFGDDPFAWDENNKPKKNNKNEFGSDFDFDFNSQKTKPKAPEKKVDVAEFLDDHTEDKPKDNFDPFALDNQYGANADPVSALADLKFEVPQAPKADIFQSEPIIESEDVPEVITKEEVNKRDPSDLWSQKKLFDLSNLKKDPSKLEIFKDQTKNNSLGSNNFNNGLGQGFSSNFDNSGFGGSMGSNFGAPQKAPETKEEKINALESAFGSSQDTVAPQQPVAAPVQQPKMAEPQNSNNDFGEFPTMFGSTPDGFGTFKGFDEDAFSSKPTNQNTKQGNNGSVPAQDNSDVFGASAPAQPKQVKKDDWFEF